MTLSIDVVDIKNNMHQLNALPIEESVFVLFSEKPDPEQVKKYVSLFRIDSESTWPSVGDPNYSQILYSKEKFGNVEYDFEIVADADKFSLQIDPIEKLYTNSRYVLFVQKGLSPQYYATQKLVARGNSSISVQTKGTEALVDESVYEILITATSLLEPGKHTIRFDLYKDSQAILTNYALDILSFEARINLNDNTYIVFNNKYPFINTERFRVTLDSASRLINSKTQEIQTHIDADVIKAEDNPSGRIEYADILNFYKDNVFIQQPEPIPTSPTTLTASVAYKTLSSFVVTFNRDISTYNLNTSSFEFSFSEAFDNYLLKNIAKYSENNKYVITYKLIGNYTVLFSIRPDTTNIVPALDRYVLLGA
jgi:hypothetical protein